MEICYGNIGRRSKRHFGTKLFVIPCLLLIALAAGVFLYSSAAGASTGNQKAIPQELNKQLGLSRTLELSKTSEASRQIVLASAKSAVQAQEHFILTNSSKPVKVPAKEKAAATPPVKAVQDKVAYLTFDDGPSRSITPQVLNILDRYGIKASFFLIGSECKRFPDLVDKENKAGHSICNHTYSHKYKMIYSSVKSFMADVSKCDAEIKSILGNGYSSKYVRFPGGGFGKKYEPYKNALTNKGCSTASWDIDTGDSLGMGVPSEKLIENVKRDIEKLKKNKSVVILMHDIAGKQTTVDALPAIIEHLKSEGYSFAALK